MYFGEFKKAKAEGYGIYYYNRKNEEDEGDRYEGQHKEWDKNGKGIYFYKNGDRYEGDFKNDKKDGKGIVYYNNGDREMEIILKEKCWKACCSIC